MFNNSCVFYINKKQDGRPVFFSASALPMSDWVVLVTRTCEALLASNEPSEAAEALAFLSRALSVEDLCVSEHVVCAWMWLTAVAHAKRQDLQAAANILRVLGTERGLDNSMRFDWIFLEPMQRNCFFCFYFQVVELLFRGDKGSHDERKPHASRFSSSASDQGFHNIGCC